MIPNLEAFQALLLDMRQQFLDELIDRCDTFDNLILALEKSPEDRSLFNELYRGVHSLKGSGGTHGLSILTTICHQFENILTETATTRGFGDTFTTLALAYIDLMRQVEGPARRENPDFTAIESELARLRQNSLQTRKAVLIAESSSLMARIYQKVMDDLPVQVSTVDDGLSALERLIHESFDLVIVGRELKELNGVALLAALQASNSSNKETPVVMVSSNTDPIPAYIHIKALLARDQRLTEKLHTVLLELGLQ